MSLVVPSWILKPWKEWPGPEIWTWKQEQITIFKKIKRLAISQGETHVFAEPLRDGCRCARLFAADSCSGKGSMLR